MSLWKRPSPALVVSLLALFVSLGGLGVAATGGNFILGQSNSAGSQTSLHGTVNGNSGLRVENAGTAALSNGMLGKMTLSTAGADTAGVKGLNASTDPGAAGVIGQNTGGGPGLKAVVKPGAAPLSVNSQGKVTDLNVDLLDGLDSTGLVPAGLVFGDGSDGDFTTSTATTTLTQDMYYDDLTIAAGQTLNPNGYRVFVAGTLTLENGSSIARNGNDGSVTIPINGAGLAAGTLGGAGGGKDSCSSLDPQVIEYSLGGNGGGAGDFCDSGTTTPPPVSAGGSGVFRSALTALSGRALDGTRVNGGAGGATENPDSRDVGGPGGGGGVVVVAARRVTASGTASITADGGRGVELTGCDGCGGGGGGGGGVVVVLSVTPQPAGVTISAAGGDSDPSDAGPAPVGSPGYAAWLS